jgi:hypothetical protein
LTFLYSLLIDVFLLRFITIVIGSIFEAKHNLKNCYYLTEAHGSSTALSSNDTTRDLVEEELNLLGEFYEDYDRPIVTIDNSSSQFGERMTPRQNEYLKTDINLTPGATGNP